MSGFMALSHDERMAQLARAMDERMAQLVRALHERLREITRDHVKKKFIESGKKFVDGCCSGDSCLSVFCKRAAGPRGRPVAKDFDRPRWSGNGVGGRSLIYSI